MRVALNGLFLSAPATGTGQYLRELVRAMSGLAQDRFTFISPHSDASAPAPIQLAPTILRSPNLAKLEFEHLTFPRAARRGNFHIAHVPHFGPPLAPSLPTVITIHDLIPMVLPAYRGSVGVQLYTRLASVAARRADAIIADSNSSARDIAEHLRIPRERIQTVYLAAGERFQPVGEDKIRRVREKYQLPERFVLYLGGFDTRKNVGQLIRSFARLDDERRAGWKLVIAGQLPEVDSSFFPDPRRLARELGVDNSILSPGFVAEEDKPALYSSARAFLYPSDYEGFGLPPLEAMACGTPVIASNRSSLPEVVGSAGCLLDPHDTDGWCESVRAVIHKDSLVEDLRPRGLAQARRFSWERAARETLAVYQDVWQRSRFSLQSVETG